MVLLTLVLLGKQTSLTGLNTVWEIVRSLRMGWNAGGVLGGSDAKLGGGTHRTHVSLKCLPSAQHS